MSDKPLTYADAGDGEQESDRDCEASGEHSPGLLATTAWKSKRLVSSALDE